MAPKTKTPPSSPPKDPSESPRPVEGNTLQLLQEWAAQEDDDNDSALGYDAESSTASLASSILRYREVNGRTYHSDHVTANQYYSPNDDKQSNTLDIMHHVCTIALDGKLHLAPLGKITKAVDIGTGTGIWAIDFADAHPEAEIIGTDISPIQPRWVPPNVKFEIEDFTKDWTFEHDSLDYVHLRYLIGAVVDWTALFKEAYAALKPGGWIESYDFNGFFQSDDGTVVEKTASHIWGEICRDGIKKLGMDVDPALVDHHLQRTALKEAGFVNIQEKPLKLPSSEWPEDPKLKEIGLFARVAIENDAEGMIGLLAAQLGWNPEDVAVYAAWMRKELRGLKVHAYYAANVAWAQKPLEST